MRLLVAVAFILDSRSIILSSNTSSSTTTTSYGAITSTGTSNTTSVSNIWDHETVRTTSTSIPSAPT